jgi:hypothetical protein
LVLSGGIHSPPPRGAGQAARQDQEAFEHSIAMRGNDFGVILPSETCDLTNIRDFESRSAPARNIAEWFC